MVKYWWPLNVDHINTQARLPPWVLQPEENSFTKRVGLGRDLQAVDSLPGVHQHGEQRGHHGHWGHRGHDYQVNLSRKANFGNSLLYIMIKTTPKTSTNKSLSCKYNQMPKTRYFGAQKELKLFTLESPSYLWTVNNKTLTKRGRVETSRGGLCRWDWCLRWEPEQNCFWAGPT